MMHAMETEWKLTVLQCALPHCCFTTQRKLGVSTFAHSRSGCLPCFAESVHLHFDEKIMQRQLLRSHTEDKTTQQDKLLRSIERGMDSMSIFAFISGSIQCYELLFANFYIVTHNKSRNIFLPC